MSVGSLDEPIDGPGGRSLAQLLDRGRDEGVYSAAVALVGRRGELRWQGVTGRVSRNPASPPATPGTIFDLASLTKPLATTLALMLLEARGLVHLETTLGEVLTAPWLPPDKRSLTLKSLLAHRSGLPALRPFHQIVAAAPETERPRLLPRLAAAEPLEYAPGTAYLYSDLGFMLLQAVVEEASGQGLETFCHRELYEPLGFEILGFRPLARLDQKKFTWAATDETDTPGIPPRGVVHDENARAAGGVAGHAGLFGTAADVFTLVAWFHRAYHGRSDGLEIPPAIVRRYLTPVAPGERTPGFDVPTPAQSSAGRYFSPRSVGHTGFTGTSLWLDLERGQMVVLLTNRVHMSRDKETVKAYRTRFHEAASLALGIRGT